MAATFCDSADVILKAGLNAPTLTAGEYVDLINYAEGEICLQVGYDFITNYSSVNTWGQYALKNACAAYAAYDLISYDQTSYLNSAEVTNLLNKNATQYDNAISQLKKEGYGEKLVE